MEDHHKNEPTESTEKGQVKPYEVLLFLGVILGILVVLSVLFPKKGIPITEDFSLRFLNFSDLWEEDSSKADMKAILAEIDVLGKADSTLVADTNQVPTTFDKVHSKNHVKKIQYPEGDKSILYPAFEALRKGPAGNKPLRIMHFGDSQIEGDRMTSLIRARFQEKFGGSGPGLTAAVPAVPSFSVRQDHSENWKRFPGYGRKNKSVKHQRYGPLAAFGRFSSIQADSLLDSLDIETSWLKLERSRAAYNKAKSYNSLKMYYGHNRRPFKLKLFADDVPISEDSIPPANGLRIKTWYFDQTPAKLMLFLEGQDSPEIYGLSLENSRGIMVDNIGMRGQSGTIFSRLDRGIFKGMIDDLDVKLLLLQYGGNTVPYIKSKKSADNYGNSFKNQINFLKRMIPGVCVIVLGPSDMATKVDGKFQTYPHLMEVRDALKNAAFETGSAYFDIFEVMGGYNSMIGWVENKPALAGRDYVHFNPKGARKIAKTFVASFLEDYEAYKKQIGKPNSADSEIKVKKLPPKKKKTLDGQKGKTIGGDQ